MGIEIEAFENIIQKLLNIIYINNILVSSKPLHSLMHNLLIQSQWLFMQSVDLSIRPNRTKQPTKMAVMQLSNDE